MHVDGSRGERRLPPVPPRCYDCVALAWLSFAAGCTDVLTFLKLGDLFTSAMTGNVALLAISAGRGQTLAASRSCAALFGFALGVALATGTNALRYGLQDVRSGIRRLLLLELVLLLGSTALWSISPDPVRGPALYGIVVLSAMSMGVQAVAARCITSSGISTVVFTTALIHIVMATTRTLAGANPAGAAPNSTRPHLATLAAYVCGAVLAGLLVSQQVSEAIWMPAFAVLAALGFQGISVASQRAAPKL